MTPAARLQASIEILDALAKTAQPADRFLRDYFRARRYAGSKDRAAVGERVFSVFRHRASLAWRMDSETPRALVIASLLAEGLDADVIADLFNGEGHAPKPFTQEERTAIAHMPGEPPLAVRGEFPAFLAPELTRAFGATLLDEMIAMQARAAVDLRANTLKASAGAVLAALRADGFDAHPARFAPDGIRIPSGEGLSALSRHPLYESGAFEFQDEAAQIASLLCGATPGERILDLAAGAGGKALALAAQMRNKGEIVAADVRRAALDELERRAVRAGTTIIRVAEPRDDEEQFDAVILDAPCGGSGVWRRQPELKWRLTPERLKELVALQDKLLDAAAAHVRPGGRLLYATCSILPMENADRVEAFLARRGDYRLEPVQARWQAHFPRAPALPGGGEVFMASPLTTGTDGFFTAILVRAQSGVTAGDGPG
jgi:16S rRNA (cytosine967-C5)-methyltransferase